jgi:hypothetical protein
MNVRAGESRSLWFLVLGSIGFCAFEVAQGEWVNAAGGLVALGLFWVLMTWMDRRHPQPAAPAITEARSRQLAIRALPFFVPLFVLLLVLDISDADWLGGLLAAISLGALAGAMWVNRRAG